MTDIVDEFKIRNAKYEDIEEIKAIDEEHGGLNEMLDQKFSEMLEDSDSYFIVSTFKDKVVGYAGGILRHTEFGESDPIGYITHVGLSKEFQSKGMGRMMGDRLIDQMSQKTNKFRTVLGFDRIDLQSFFNHLGFNRTDLLVYEYTN